MYGEFVTDPDYNVGPEELYKIDGKTEDMQVPKVPIYIYIYTHTSLSVHCFCYSAYAPDIGTFCSASWEQLRRLSGSTEPSDSLAGSQEGTRTLT